MFQSTPAIAGGRIRAIDKHHQHHNSFNPRPPLLAGESCAANLVLRVLRRFNPRPPLLAGESRVIRRTNVEIPVSIHARHCWRANPRRRGLSMDCRPFQSTPAIAGGRIGHGRRIETTAPWFQSTPAIAGGRIYAIPALWQHLHCFNPRPPLLAGESMVAGTVPNVPVVSIHARHCWRANLLVSKSAHTLSEVSIHARHCWRANPDRCCTAIMRPSFQSTPAIAGGRITFNSLPTTWMIGFNPRPPLLAGESDAGAVGDPLLLFQSTPAIAGGRIDNGVLLPDAVEVSIHARHCWRANLTIEGAHQQGKRFQSTPAIAGGRIARPRLQSRQRKSFNPRPPLLAGESPLRLPMPATVSAFQSTPAIAGGRIKR